jgi:hypothetical protein
LARAFSLRAKQGGTQGRNKESEKYPVMSYELQSPMGALEAVIDDNCGLKKFYSIANVMARELKVKFVGKEDDSATVEWHFKYKGHPLTLYYNIYNGVSIFQKAGKPNKVISELANFLQGKAF